MGLVSFHDGALLGLNLSLGIFGDPEMQGEEEMLAVNTYCNIEELPFILYKCL